MHTARFKGVLSGALGDHPKELVFRLISQKTRVLRLSSASGFEPLTHFREANATGCSRIDGPVVAFVVAPASRAGFAILVWGCWQTQRSFRSSSVQQTRQMQFTGYGVDPRRYRTLLDTAIDGVAHLSNMRLCSSRRRNPSRCRRP